MRVRLCVMLFVLSTLGIAIGQDTNFPSGPQYLMNYGSPVFARSISTPSITLTDPPLQVGASNATGVLITAMSSKSEQARSGRTKTAPRYNMSLSVPGGISSGRTSASLASAYISVIFTPVGKLWIHPAKN